MKSFKIQISGRVQGVGFRPFVFNLAKKYQLKGTVSNNAQGVIIILETTKEKVVRFLEEILEKNPLVSIITSHELKEIPFQAFDDFTILPSKENAHINVPLTPDFAVCESCKTEIKDPNNRRYQYPFTTCVHCGPRYAITTQFPFEREHTSLATFKMCASCDEEYKNPEKSRFHSQTNSCSTCGIQMNLVSTQGEVMKLRQQEIIKKTAALIAKGNILSIKNTNGYLLCCDASNPEAIQKLRTRKRRPSKPFAVLYPTLEAINADFELSLGEEKNILSSVAPIVILQNTKKTKIAANTIAPKLHQTGVMLPSSALLALIMEVLKKPMVATSGNIHGDPILSTEKEVEKQLKNVADYFLHHDLEIQFPQDDSVIKLVDNEKIILRRSRGMAPNYIDRLSTFTAPVMAMGAQLKSTFSFAPNTHIYVSQYFGNLDHYNVLVRYKKVIMSYTVLFNKIPKMILIDKHAQYQSSILGRELAEKWNTDLVAIQHHKAHFTSVLGEHDLFATTEKILGIVWDGTGWGDDQNVWGGEFFVYQNRKIDRLTHFEYFDWIVQDKMAKEPRISLFCLLDDENKNSIRNKFSETEWKIYLKIIKNNTLKTSSVGRLFDAVSSILNLADTNTFEGEAAMLLENCANSYSENDYIDFLQNKTYHKIPSKFIIKTILKAYQEGISKEKLAYSFIYTLAKSIIKITKKNQIKTIACSGGVFQNSLLICILSFLTKNEGINLRLNRKLSPNDENISFGQLMYQENIKN